jgi:biotin transporter BioY
MKSNVNLLTITSLLTLLLLIMHITDDIVRGLEPGTLTNLNAVNIAAVWLCATLLLAGRRSGYIVLLILSLLATGIPIIHFRGAGVARIARMDGGYLFVWTLLTLGTSALFSFILSIRGLWGLRKNARVIAE